MYVLSRLKESAAKAELIAENRRVMVLAVERCIHKLEKTGMLPRLDGDDAGNISITFNVNGEKPTAPPVPQSLHARAKPVVDDTVEPPEPAPKAEPEPEPAPKAKITGPFSEAEDQTVVDMAAAGSTSLEIADALNRNASAIGMKMKQQLRIRIENARLKGENQAAAEQAQTTAPSPQPKSTDDGAYVNEFELSGRQLSIDRHLHDLGYPDGWTPERDSLLMHALLTGQKLAGAASVLGISEIACRDRWFSVNQSPGDLDHQKDLAKVLGMRALAAEEES